MSRHLFPALLSTATFVALVIAVFGFTRLWTDADVIPERDAGTLVGPVMIVVTAAAVFAGLLWIARVRAAGGQVVGTVLAVGFGAVLVWAATGAVVALFATGLPGRALIFLSARLISPFALAIGACALAAAVVFLLVFTPDRRR